MWSPPADLPVPSQISALAGPDKVRPVWRNELGGLTFEITGPDGRRFAKWAPAGSGLDLASEAARLRWAAAFTPVHGTWSGHVDLGALGVADRWADLAVATWSLDRNYGPGWQPTLLQAYGIEPDPRRIAYYRLLWDLSP